MPRLRMNPTMQAPARARPRLPAIPLDAELGYGFAAPLLSGTVTPYTGLGLSSEDAHTFRLGARWEVMPAAALSLEGARRESAASEADHGVMLRGALQW